MAKSAVLAIRIIGDATKAISAMDQASGKADKFGRGLDTASKWAAGGLAAITGAAVLAGKSASDLEQATGAVASVFGEYAGQMTKYGEDAATAVGLSQTEYGNMASILGSQLKNMGISVGDAAGQTNDLIGLGSDLAATFGGSTSDAVSALSSLLRGERDPIERYGVSIKQADIDAQKAAMGLSGLTGEAAKNADLQATLALLTTQTADAQGQFARESGSAAGSAQIAAAQFENAKAALGEALLPIMTDASQKLAELAGWFRDNASWITPLVGAVGALAAGIIVINGAYKAFAAVQAIQTAAQWASNAAWLASPITWIVLAVVAAIALLIAAIVLVVQNWDTIAAKASEVWSAVIGWIQGAIEWVQVRVVAAVMIAAAIWTNIKNAATAALQAVIGWVQNAIQWVQVRIIQAVIGAAAIFSRISAAASAAFGAVIGWVQNAAGWIGGQIGNAVQGALSWFYSLRDNVTGVFQTIISWVQNALSWLRNLASNAIPGWAQDLLGMRAFSMPITPEVAPLSAPLYLARMAVTPEVGAFAAPAPQEYAAAFAAAPMLRAPSPVAPAPRSSAAAAPAYTDNREQNFHFPNYTGDRSELINWIREALRRGDINSSRIITA